MMMIREMDDNGYYCDNDVDNDNGVGGDDGEEKEEEDDDGYDDDAEQEDDGVDISGGDGNGCDMDD